MKPPAAGAASMRPNEAVHSLVLAPRDRDLLKCCLQPLRQLLRIVIGPEVNEEEAWLLVQHMAVDGRHLDAIFA